MTKPAWSWRPPCILRGCQWNRKPRQRPTAACGTGGSEVARGPAPPPARRGARLPRRRAGQATGSCQLTTQGQSPGSVPGPVLVEQRRRHGTVAPGGPHTLTVALSEARAMGLHREGNEHVISIDTPTRSSSFRWTRRMGATPSGSVHACAQAHRRSASRRTHTSTPSATYARADLSTRRSKRAMHRDGRKKVSVVCNTL
jgi:hypothetical protein